MAFWGEAAGWWVLAGLLVAVELVTGTFYLLMLAIGAVAAAIAASLGASLLVQVLIGACLGGAAVGALHLRRRREPRPEPAASNPDVNMDVGSRIQVEQWNLDGSARVFYRGASWAARHVGNDLPIPGEYIVRGLDGQTLLLGR